MSREPVAFSIGLLHVFLATAVAFLLVDAGSQTWPIGGYLAVGLALVFGFLLIVGLLRSILEKSLTVILLDSLAISLLLVSTGGETSSFFALYLLAAFGISRIQDIARCIAGSVILIGGYLSAVVISAEAFGTSLSPVAGFEDGLIALSCAIAAALGTRLRGAGDNGQHALSTLTREQRYVERAESLLLDVGPLLETLSPEGVMRWTAQAARRSLGAPYAHVATLDGHFHQTSADEDGEAYPSWWHPEIQRLLLWSCRTGEIARGDEPVHGMEKLVALPLDIEGSESIGAVIVGGVSFSAEDERALRLLASQVAPILEQADEAPGGCDPVSGVPNRDSLRHVLKRELSYSKPLAVFAVDPGLSSSHNQFSGRDTEDFLLRQTAQKLRETHQYVFHYAENTFVALSGGAGKKKVSATARGTLQIVDQVTGNPEHSTAAVGFTTTGEEHRGPSQLLDAALEALEKAKVDPTRVAGPPTGAGGRERSISREVQALAETIGVRDPELGEHSRAVSRLASLIGSRISLSKDQVDLLVPGALLHDIGKIGIADSILHKPASLSPKEYETMKLHPLLGARILNSIPELSPILPAVKHHHERFDGEGYPDGLRGGHIPLVARIISVADALETITRDRPYRRGRSEREALHEIIRNSGTQFDPEVVRALQEAIGEPSVRELN